MEFVVISVVSLSIKANLRLAQGATGAGAMFLFTTIKFYTGINAVFISNTVILFKLLGEGGNCEVKVLCEVLLNKIF